MDIKDVLKSAQAQNHQHHFHLHLHLSSGAVTGAAPPLYQESTRSIPNVSHRKALSDPSADWWNQEF